MDVTSFNPFTTVLANAIASGLVGGAVVDRNGNARGVAGAVDEGEAMPLAALVVAVLDTSSAERLELVRELRDHVARMLHEQAEIQMPVAGSGGQGGSGPAELPLVEYGVTVARGKA